MNRALPGADTERSRLGSDLPSSEPFEALLLLWGKLYVLTFENYVQKTFDAREGHNRATFFAALGAPVFPRFF